MISPLAISTVGLSSRQMKPLRPRRSTVIPFNVGALHGRCVHPLRTAIYLMLAAHKKRMQRANQLTNLLSGGWVDDRRRLDLIFKRGKVGTPAVLAVRGSFQRNTSHPAPRRAADSIRQFF